MPKGSYPVEFKWTVLQTWLEGHHTLRETAKLFEVGTTSIKNWKYRWETYGIDGLMTATTFKKYSKEEKLAMINDALSGEYSINDVVRKYELSSSSVLRRWIQRYNCHREDIKGTTKGRESSMTKGRRTTWEERMEIVEDCLSKKKDYRATAECYDVSYQQVYQWVRKYEENGEEALQDRRGRAKKTEELSPEEKAKLEMKKLARENERLRAENAFLKKSSKPSKGGDSSSVSL